METEGRKESNRWSHASYRCWPAASLLLAGPEGEIRYGDSVHERVRWMAAAGTSRWRRARADEAHMLRAKSSYSQLCNRTSLLWLQQQLCLWPCRSRTTTTIHDPSIHPWLSSIRPSLSSSAPDLSLHPIPTCFAFEAISPWTFAERIYAGKWHNSVVAPIHRQAIDRISCMPSPVITDPGGSSNHHRHSMQRSFTVFA